MDLILQLDRTSAADIVIFDRQIYSAPLDHARFFLIVIWILILSISASASLLELLLLTMVGKPNGESDLGQGETAGDDDEPMNTSSYDSPPVGSDYLDFDMYEPSIFIIILCSCCRFRGTILPLAQSPFTLILRLGSAPIPMLFGGALNFISTQGILKRGDR